MKSIDNTISDWKVAVGVIKTSNTGATYLVVPIPDMRGNFLKLIQTLIDRGFNEEEIKSAGVNTKIAKACWSDMIKKLTSKEIKRNRDIATSIWRETLSEYFAKPISEYVETKKEAPVVRPSVKEPTKEELLEKLADTTNRLVSTQKIDRETDSDLMAELGIEVEDV